MFTMGSGLSLGLPIDAHPRLEVEINIPRREMAYCEPVNSLRAVSDVRSMAVRVSLAPDHSGDICLERFVPQTSNVVS